MTINTGTAKILLVEVPDGGVATRLHYDVKEACHYLRVQFMVDFKVSHQYIKIGIKAKPGELVFLGIAPEISEEEWGKVLQDVKLKQVNNPSGSISVTYRKANIEDAYSLISSQGMVWERVVVIKVNDCSHSNITRTDGLDKCLDCGATNY